jgi:hypothetical protein
VPVIDARPLAATDLHLVTWGAPAGQSWPVADVRALATAAGAAALAAHLPDVVTPVAALGRAVRDDAACPPGHRWVHVRQHEGASRWLLCRADVDETRARIEGYDGAEAAANGSLTIDAGVPAAVAAALRAAYDAARGVVDAARVNAAVARVLARAGARGVKVAPNGYLCDGVDGDVRAAVDAVARLGGLAVCLPIPDAAAPTLAAPVARAVADDAARVLADVADLAARCRASAAGDPGAPDVRGGSGETARRQLDEARERLATWRDRLGVQLSDVDRALRESGDALAVALRGALAAQDGRRDAAAGRAPAALPDAGPVDAAARRAARRAARQATPPDGDPV